MRWCGGADEECGHGRCLLKGKRIIEEAFSGGKEGRTNTRGIG